MPGNYTIQSKYLSITVVSLRGGEVNNFTIVADRSRFIIPDLKPNGKIISFLEVGDKVTLIRWICYVKKGKE